VEHLPSWICWSRLLGAFGGELSLDLAILLTYFTFLLAIKASILGKLRNIVLTLLFLMWFSLTWVHLICKIHLITPWWKIVVFSFSLLDSTSHSPREECSGGRLCRLDVRCWSTSLLVKKCLVYPIRDYAFLTLSLISVYSFNREVMVEPRYLRLLWCVF
jgi:hypothetical protein